MNNTQHTSGPWKAVGDGPFIATLGNRVICKIYTTVENSGFNCQVESPANWEAIHNARLIAAAPEMLELLNTIVREVEGFERRTGAMQFVKWLSDARSIIAKLQEDNRP